MRILALLDNKYYVYIVSQTPQKLFSTVIDRQNQSKSWTVMTSRLEIKE